MQPSLHSLIKRSLAAWYPTKGAYPPGPQFVSVAAGCCFFASGFLSLVYEVCWIRKAALVFGTVTFALSTVLAVFFAGLAIGSYFFGRSAIHCQRPLRNYAVLEFGVAVLALLSPFAFQLANTFFHHWYPAVSDGFWALALMRLGILTALLLPPTILMGGTLPLLCQHFLRDGGELSRPIGWLYALNTLGAAAGCAVCGFWSIRYLGVNATLWVGGAFNGLVGAIAWRLPPPAAPRKGRRAESAELPDPLPGLRGVFGLLLLTGFVALANEVLISRFLTLLMHNTVYTFTLTLVVILCGIVTGSAATTIVSHRISNRGLLFGGLQLAIGLSTLGVLMLPPAVWRTWFAADHLAAQFAIVATILFIPAALSGASFPLAVRLASQRTETAALRVGQLAAVNTLGGILGAMCAGFLLLPCLGLQASVLLCSGLSLAAGLLAWNLPECRQVRFPKRAAIAALALWIAMPAVSGTQLPGDYLGSNGELIEYREGISAHVAVVRRGHVKQLEVDRLWQGEDQKTHQIMAAHLPMLLHEDPRSVLVVGIGPGQTASRFLMYPIDQLDCVDIEPALIPLVRRHFQSGWMDDPRTRLLVDDGRNYLSHTRERYDVISIELGQAFRPGVASFYTRDFYEHVQQRLARQGVVSQFVSLDFLDAQQMRTVVRTFISVFPQSTLWYNRSELLLIGAREKSPSISAQHLKSVLEIDRVKRDLQFSYWGCQTSYVSDPHLLLAGFVMGPAGLRQLAGDAPVYRDDRPFLEYAAAVSVGPAKEKAVALLRPLREPVSTIYSGVLNHATVRVRQLQNLDDLVAQELVWQANSALETGQEAAAFRHLQQALRWNPQNFWANLMLADAWMRRGEVERAIGLYETAVALRPTHPQARAALKAAQP